MQKDYNISKYIINITTRKNIIKYLTDKQIKTELKNIDLLNFAIAIRKSELDDLIIEYKECKTKERKCEIQSLKQQYFDERFFLTEGIQEVDYGKYDKLFLNFISGEELYNHNKLTGINYFEFFSSFIDVLPNFCRVRTNAGQKILKKNDLIDIFADVKLYIVNEYREISEKLIIKEFLKSCLYRKQVYEIREEIQKTYTP